MARTEWILVLGYLMNKVPAATSFFNKVKKNYLSYKSKRPVSKKKIKVLLGSKSNGDWQAPKKLSYLGILVEDAGGENLLTKNLRTEQSFSFENILKLKKNVDIWLPHTTWQNKKEMIKEDSKYSLLINNSQIDIYNASKKSSAIAGYDFWETGLSRPDLILKDLQSIFRKTIKGELRWYQKL